MLHYGPQLLTHFAHFYTRQVLCYHSKFFTETAACCFWKRGLWEWYKNQNDELKDAKVLRRAESWELRTSVGTVNESGDISLLQHLLQYTSSHLLLM